MIWCCLEVTFSDSEGEALERDRKASCCESESSLFNCLDLDLVATGRTLRDNGLIAIEDLFHTTARLVGHPLSLRLDQGDLRQIVEAMRSSTPASKVAS